MLRRFKQLIAVMIGMVLVATLPLNAQENDTTEAIAEANQDQDSDVDALSKHVREMVLAGETRDAMAFLESKVAEDPDNVDAGDVQRSYAMVVAGFNRIRNIREAYKTLNRLFEFQISRLESNPGDIKISGTVRSILAIAPRISKQNDIDGVINRAIEAAEKLAANNDDFQFVVELSNLQSMKAMMLMQNKKREEALAIFERESGSLKTLYQSRSDDDLVMAVYARSLSNLMRLTEDEKRRDSLYEEHQKILTKRMNDKPENMSFATQYIVAVMFKASVKLEDNPQAAIELLDDADKVLSDIELANDKATQVLRRVKMQLAALRKRGEAQVIINELIGQSAIELDAEFWINGQSLDAGDLAGKVVMLDFWAVWSKPSIQTFPRLKKLNETYGDKGLQIVGVTGRYNVRWDEEKARPVPGQFEVDADEEAQTIERFMKQHDLTYPSIVMPKDSTMGEFFGVSGIPHVVLIDKKGKVRLIKVGGGDEKAAQIETMIKELLAE